MRTRNYSNLARVMLLALGLVSSTLAQVSGAGSAAVNGTVGTPFVQTFTGTILGNPSGAWSFSSSPALPAGVTVAWRTSVSVYHAFQVSGTLTAPLASTSYTITATQAGATGSATLSLGLYAASPLTWTTSSANAATVGRSYSLPLAVSGNTGPVSYSLQTGSLPSGVGISGSSLSGTPTQSGSYSFTLRATDSESDTADQSFALDVNDAVSIASTQSAFVVTGNGFSRNFSSTGGTTPLVWSVSGLPTGLNYSSSNGAIAGTPSSAGTYTITATVTDTNGSSDAETFTLTVGPPLSLTGGPLGPYTQGTSMGYTLPATGGASPYHFVSNSQLPPGLSLSSLGILSGTPTQMGMYSMNVTVTDQASGSQSATFTISVINPITVTMSGLSTITANTSASGQAGATGGGGGPYTYAVTSGSLPAGVTLASSGSLTGSPTQAGSFSFTVTATDQSSHTGEQSFNWTVSPALQVQFPAFGSSRVGKALTADTQVQGGTAPVTISLSSGSLPSGLSMSSGGAITGTPSAAGSYSFTIRVADSGGAVATNPVTLTVGPALQMSPSGTLSPATVNVGYSIQLGIINADGPGVFSVGASTLPPGLSLNGSVISGTPTQAGSYMFGVEGRLENEVVTAMLSLTVNPAFEFKLPVAPTLVAGSAFTWTPVLTGGTPPYLVAISGTSLPAGIALDRNTGVISGTPATAGTLAFSIEALDQNGARVQHYVQLDVKSPILFTPQIARVAKLGEPWSVKLEASNGVAPYTYSLASGALPVGVALSGEALSGAPTTAGTYTFKLAATDAKGLKVEKPFTVVVTDGFLLSTNSLGFVAQPGQVSGRRTLKLDSIPVGVDVTVGELPAWLKASATASATPGAIDFWVAPGAELPSGDHTTTVFFESPGLQAQKLEVKLKLARSEDYTLSVNSWALPAGMPERAVMLQTGGAEVSYKLHLEGPGAPSYRLPVNQGTATPNHFNLVSIETSDDTSRRGLETTLVIENQSIEQTLRVPIDVSQVAPIGVSSNGLTLRIPNAEPQVATAKVLVKTQSGKRRFALTVDSPWLTVTPMEGVLDPEQELHIDARKRSDDAGAMVGLVTIYLEDGKPAHIVPVTVLHLPVIDSATPLVSMSRQVFDSRQSGAELTLTNPADRVWNFAVRSTSSKLAVEQMEGQLAPGESRTLKVSATEFAQPESLFVSFGDGSPVVMDVFWLAPQKNCVAQPTLEWVTPQRGSVLPVGASALVQALLTNGCGEALTSGSMAVLDAQGQPVNLLGSTRGIWSGYLLPGTAEGNRMLELLYLSADGKSQLRKLLNVDLKQ